MAIIAMFLVPVKDQLNRKSSIAGQSAMPLRMTTCPCTNACSHAREILYKPSPSRIRYDCNDSITMSAPRPEQTLEAQTNQRARRKGAEHVDGVDGTTAATSRGSRTLLPGTERA